MSERLEDECSTADGKIDETSVDGECVSCKLALEVPPEWTDAGVLETSSELARAGPGSSWSSGASTDIDELEMGSTEADS